MSTIETLYLWIAAACLLAFVAADCTAPTQVLTTFCAGVATEFPPGYTIESLFVQLAAQVEPLLSQIWTPMITEIGKIAKAHKFAVCDACLDALKSLFCASFAPKCGYLNCIISVAQNITQCAAGCNCDPSSGTVTDQCLQCTGDCGAQLMAHKCAAYIMGRETCKQFVSICACNPSAAVVDGACAFFPESGFNMTLGGGSCAGASGWCAPTRKRDSTNGQVCPNDNMCIGAPQSTGSQSAKASSPLKSSSDSSAGMALTASVLLAGVAAVAAMLL